MRRSNDLPVLTTFLQLPLLLFSCSFHTANGAGLWGKMGVVCPEREDLMLTGAQAGHTIRVGDQWWTDGLPSTDKGYTPNACLFGKDHPVVFWQKRLSIACVPECPEFPN